MSSRSLFSAHLASFVIPIFPSSSSLPVIFLYPSPLFLFFLFLVNLLNSSMGFAGYVVVCVHKAARRQYSAAGC
jgi:hypothetical protein